MTYMIVYEDGTTETVRGNTLEEALYNISTSRQYDIVAAIKI